MTTDTLCYIAEMRTSLLIWAAMGCDATPTEKPADDATGDTGSGSWSPPDQAIDGSSVEIETASLNTCWMRDRDPEQPFSLDVRLGDMADHWIPWEDPIAGYGWGLAIEDFNGDGHLDLFLPNLGFDRLLLGDGTGSFSDASDTLPMGVYADEGVDTSGVAATDIDGDGDVDIYLANRGPDRILSNLGDGTFEDITLSSGILREDLDSISATWGHMDNDGLPDLFVSTYIMGTFPFEVLQAGGVPEGDPNRLYRNLGGGQFELVPLPGDASRTFAFTAGWHDIDGDRDADLIVVNDLGPIVVPNLVLRNDDGTLVSVPDSTLARPMYGMGLAVQDLNGDDQPDFLMSSWDEMIWMVSDGEGDWYEDSRNWGLSFEPGRRHIAWGAELADIDNDTDADALVAFGHLNMDPIEQTFFEQSLSLMNPEEQADWVLRNNGGTFDSVDATWGLDDTTGSRELMPADINGDGWLDLVRRSKDAPAALHMAHCGDDGALLLRLSDLGPNTLGLGVTVVVTPIERDGTRGSPQRITVQAGSTGIASSRPHQLHFGLGAAPWAAIEVQWLDGTTTKVSHVESNQRIQIRRQ